MDIVFKKLKVENRFHSSFENWNKNNVITFSNQGFIDVYAPNGVGKSSFARALSNENKCEYEFEYNGKTYTEKSKESPVLVIDDFFFRNIAKRDNEKLSDYILGKRISKELELKDKLELNTKKIRDEMISYLKNEFGLKTKDSILCKYIKNKSLKIFIDAIANAQDKGKVYTAEKLIKLSAELVINDIVIEENSKYYYLKQKIGAKESIIKDIIDFNTQKIKKIEGFKSLDISNDAINILNKHNGLTKCIFEDTHILPNDIKEQLENNKNLIIKQLDSSQKKIVNILLESEDGPFNIKEIYNNSFELGDASKIDDLIQEIKEIILKIENEIILKYKKLIKDYDLESDYLEFNKMVAEKVELSEDDEMLLKDIIENCINRKVKLERDENKNIIFTIEDSSVIGKSRQELPLSTGEQNFISLYFDLLSAKNSNKEIIIIDDPISSFDSIYKNKIVYSIIKVLSNNNKKVIVLTHNINTIKLMYHQYENCFNLYLLNNENNGENGFIRINKKQNRKDVNKDMDFMLEIHKVIDFFKSQELIEALKDKKLFLVSLIPFMRSYSNLVNKDMYKELCKLMHGYENEEVDINKKFKILFDVDILEEPFEINIDDIIKIDIKDEIIDKEKYVILNRTLYHNLNYLQLRLLVENTLYNTDITKLDVSRNPTLHSVIEKYLSNSTKYKNELLSQKTLLNEFNHFEYDMCLFLPSLDISDTKLEEEKANIVKICEKIKANGI